MRKRTIDLMQDCLAVLESADIEDTDALIGQLKAEIALYMAKAAVREAFEVSESPKPAVKPVKRKPASKSKHTNAKAPAIVTSTPLTAA